MKIIRLTASNILRLRAVSITPKGNVVVIKGRNDVGKSSVLNAIWLALQQIKVDAPEPIRSGEDKAFVRLELGGEKVELIVERRYTKGGGESLFVENSEGARFRSPQAMLDNLVGAIAFDPLEFARMKPIEQREALRKLVDLGGVDIDELDKLNRQDFQTRATYNRIEKEKRAQAGLAEEGVPDELIDLTQHTEAIDAARARNEARAALWRTREEAQKRLVDLMKKIGERRQKAEDFRQQALKLDQEVAELLAQHMKEEADLNEQPQVDREEDLVPLKAALAQAIVTNNHVAERKMFLAKIDEADEYRSKAAALTAIMKEREAVKAKAISEAKMPVEGLGFGENCITLNGVPFQQASSMQKTEASLRIAMAANPKLRIARIMDGSLLDEDSQKRINEMAVEHDFQIFIECVDSSGKTGIVIEDGSVIAVDGEPVAEQAEAAQ